VFDSRWRERLLNRTNVGLRFEMEVVRMKIVNMTPHEVRIRVQDAEVVIPPSGQTIRLPEMDRAAGSILIDSVEVPLIVRNFNRPPLPNETEPTVMVVSLPVIMSLSVLPDSMLPENILFVAPDTGSGAIRGKDGNIEATTRLITTERLLAKFNRTKGGDE
jgi:hypothetical protein